MVCLVLGCFGGVCLPLGLLLVKHFSLRIEQIAHYGEFKKGDFGTAWGKRTNEGNINMLYIYMYIYIYIYMWSNCKPQSAEATVPHGIPSISGKLPFPAIPINIHHM